MIAVRDLTRQFVTPAGKFQALSGVTLEVRAGEFMAIVGRSGSGKSTLLNLMAGLDRPTSGTVSIGGNSIHQLSNDHLARWRGRTVGVVFQFFQLLPTLTVAENVMLPMDFAGTHPGGMRRARALELLSRVGVSDQADKLPAALSGGQQQRVAIARALVTEPAVIFADEPTGNLDSSRSHEIMKLLEDLNARRKMTIVLVTHEEDIAAYAKRQIRFRDGKIASDTLEQKAAE